MKIAIIPARAGSKRIKDKNIKLFNGRPLIIYSIEAAVNAALFDHIIVSTDSKKIAEIARDSGAQVPFLRPAQISGDMTGLNEVVIHAFDWCKDNLAKNIDYVCCICANPFVRTQYLIKGLEVLAEHGATSSVAVTPFESSIYRAFRIDNDNFLHMVYPEHRDTRSQELKPAYYDAGQFYWACADSYARDKDFYSAHAYPVVIPKYLSCDINDDDDWLRAEILYQTLLRQGI